MNTRAITRYTAIATLLLLFYHSSYAEQSYSPSDVYSGVAYSTEIINNILSDKNISDFNIPNSKEISAKPMHVYELHVSVLQELYDYANNNNRRPPPLAVSSPIKYEPTDVYYLTKIIINNLEELYRDNGGVVNFSKTKYHNKTPVDVYQKLFELYYKVNRLNAKSKISPSEVYSHIYRAKEDLQSSLLTLSKRLADSEQRNKRLLVTAIYGMHTDGSFLPAQVQGKKPVDVIEQAFEIRDRLNKLRQQNKLATIKRPKREHYGTVKPIDVFLQTQFIIAELNLLKIPMNIHSTTASAKSVTGKSPSDVYYEMSHIVYMLDRLIAVM